jgi:iron(III) transport system ATP-binding protein
MVFQDYALFPHLNIIDNVVFGLNTMSRRRRSQRGRQMLSLVGLQGSPERYPHELSGGQQQRVALARALASEPDLVLLDEPFSSLDVELRERLSHEVHDILKAQGITAVMVTHDQSEAFAMGEMVGVMREGTLLQWDTPFNLYHDPANRFVADFIGQGRFVSATLRTPDTLETALGVIQADRAFLWQPGTEIEVLLRPDDIIPDERATLRGCVVKKAFKGAQTLYTLRFDGGVELLSLFPSHLDFPLGQRVGVRIAAIHAVAFTRHANE